MYSGHLYAGTASGKCIYRYDGGTTWTPVTTYTGWVVRFLIAFDGNLYATNGLTSNQVYRYDGDTSWSLVSESVDGAVRCFCEHNDYLYAGTSTGKIYRYDGGTTWTSVGTLAASVNTLCEYGGDLYAGINYINPNNIVYRYDGGTTWTGVLALGTNTKHLCVYDGDLYLSTGLAGYIVIKYVSGSTWTPVYGYLGGADFLFVYDDELYAAYYGGVSKYISGTNWESVYHIRPNYVNCLYFYDSSLYIGTQIGEVYRHDGGTSWTKVSDYFLMNSIAAFVEHGGDLYAAASKIPGSLYTNSPEVFLYDGDTDWSSIGNPGTSSSVLRGIIDFGGNMYAAVSVGSVGVYRYDGGTTWTKISTDSLDYYCFAAHSGDLYVGGNASGAGRVYRYDGGTTWTAVYTFLSGSVNSLLEYDSDLYAATSTGRIYRYDGGTTWTEVGNPTVSSLTSLCIYNSDLYVSSLSGVVYRYDGGTTWTSIGSTVGGILQLISYNDDLWAGGVSITKCPYGTATLTNKISSNRGVLTLDLDITDESLVVGDLIEVKWSGGTRSYMTLIDIDVDNNQIDVYMGTGTDLPAEDTAITEVNSYATGTVKYNATDGWR